MLFHYPMANYVLIIIFSTQRSPRASSRESEIHPKFKIECFYEAFICLDKCYKGLLRCLHEMFEEPKSIMKEIWAQFLFLWEIAVRAWGERRCSTWRCSIITLLRNISQNSHASVLEPFWIKLLDSDYSSLTPPEYTIEQL